MTPTPFVLDNSISMTWCFEDEQTPFTQDVLKAVIALGAEVPSLWPLEVSSVLIQAERHGRISQADSTTFLRLLKTLPIQVDGETASRAMSETIGLARSTGIKAYDASYLELAIRKGLPIATLDKGLKRAAESLGVQILAVSPSGVLS